MKVRIGIVSGFDTEHQSYVCGQGYVRAIEWAGGLPMILPYLAATADVCELLAILDGVLLTGGSDFDPALYGGEVHPTISPAVGERDSFEFPLAQCALKRDVPILGVCRGMQCLNVAAGGTLYPDIRSFVPGGLDHQDNRPLDQVAHEVTIQAGSQLASISDSTMLQVNSSHHQAVKDLGSGLVASAHASDGIVEALESTQLHFALGVQWHPERLWENDEACRRLFRRFVDACTAKRR